MSMAPTFTRSEEHQGLVDALAVTHDGTLVSGGVCYSYVENEGEDSDSDDDDVGCGELKMWSFPQISVSVTHRKESSWESTWR
jgi:hypothetical protein